MKRRDALKGSAAIFTLLGTVPGLILNTSCSSDKPKWTAVAFNDIQGQVLQSALDVLIPRSAAPSATDVNTHGLIDEQVAQIFSEKRKTAFLSAVDRLNALAQSVKGSDYHELEIEDQNELMLQFVDDEEGQEKKGQFYNLIKGQTLTCYFRTEEVCTKVLNYVAIPGRYDGCADLEPNQPLWAE